MAVRKSWQPILIKDDNSGRELLLRVAIWTDVDLYIMIVDVWVVKLSGFSAEDEIPVEIRSSLVFSRNVEVWAQIIPYIIQMQISEIIH